MERTQDMAMGLAFAVLGIAAAVIAYGYRGASGTYPLALGAALATLGTGSLLRAALTSSNRSRPLCDNPAALATTVVAVVGYLVLVPTIGFFTSSALLVLVLPVALGLRRPILLTGTTAGFIALVYVLFTIVLERPMPPEVWQTG